MCIRDRVESLAEDIARRSGLPVRSVSPEALALLARRAWPGNIRELRNTLEQAALMTDDLVLEATSGLNAGRWQRWRLQLEFQLWRIGANAPRGIVDAAAPPRDHTALLLQLAAAFGKH